MQQYSFSLARTAWLTAVLLARLGTLYAQETPSLIPNGSFEIFDSRPTEISQLHLARPWQSVALQSNEPGDFFTTGAKPRVGVPTNFNGTEPAHGGEAYAGFIPYSRMEKGQYREFMIVTLREPLVAGCTYRAACYVSRAERSKWAVDGIQLLFSVRAPLLLLGGYTQYQPQVSASGIITETNGWTEVSGMFRASGGEKLLTLGNFQSDDDTGARRQIAKNQDKEAGDIAYYYLDDVTLEKVMEADGSPAREAPLAQQVAVLAPLPEVSILSRQPVRLNNVYFESDQADLLPASAPALNQLADLLRQHPEWRILIGGHTDNTNTENHNLLLSQRRAEAVRQYLIGQRITPARLRAQGYGLTRPIAANDTPEGRERNRRVEFTLE